MDRPFEIYSSKKGRGKGLATLVNRTTTLEAANACAKNRSKICCKKLFYDVRENTNRDIIFHNIYKGGKSCG